jgi:hypothetical protein
LKNIWRLFMVVLASATGVIVLTGYFIGGELLGLANLRATILHWVVILSAVALLVGIVNLFRVHWNRVNDRHQDSGYSMAVIVSMILTLVFVGFFGPTDPLSLWLFNYIQIPIETSLMALLAVLLIYAVARMAYRKPNVYSLIFFATVLIMLIGFATIPGLDFIDLSRVRAWIMQVPATAGARGILLGIALGIIATGVRVLTGLDRPYEAPGDGWDKDA